MSILITRLKKKVQNISENSTVTCVKKSETHPFCRRHFIIHKECQGFIFVKTNFRLGEINIKPCDVSSKISCYKNYLILRICKHTLKQNKAQSSHHFTHTKNSYFTNQTHIYHKLCPYT